MMSSSTILGGLLRFPGFGGKLLSRSRFLSGDQKAYWGPLQFSAHGFSSDYVPPGFWPNAGAPVLLIRLTRLNYRAGSSNLNQISDELLDNANKARSFEGQLYFNGVGWVGSPDGPSLPSAHPRIEDLDANDYLATDVLHFVVMLDQATRYNAAIIGGGPAAANVQTDADNINLAASQAPRYHVRTYIDHQISLQSPAMQAVNNPLYYTPLVATLGTTFPSLIDKATYSFGGTIEPTDSDSKRFQDFINRYYSIREV